jgi:hypothetical protein
VHRHVQSWQVHAYWPRVQCVERMSHVLLHEVLPKVGCWRASWMCRERGCGTDVHDRKVDTATWQRTAGSLPGLCEPAKIQKVGQCMALAATPTAENGQGVWIAHLDSSSCSSDTPSTPLSRNACTDAVHASSNATISAQSGW